MDLDEKIKQGNLSKRELELLSRRKFLKIGAAAAGSLFLPFSCSDPDNKTYGPSQTNIIIPDNPGGTIKNTQMQEGVVLASWWHDDYESAGINTTLNRLYDLGVESVEIITTWYQDTPNSLDIFGIGNKTPSDRGIENVITKTKALGMRAVLKPHVDVVDGNWRGNITHTSDSDWTQWFNSYTNFILDYAQLAERNQVDGLVIGTELGGTVNRPEWRQVINDVKTAYSGTVLYSAHWGNYKNVPFWDDLDGVGIGVYFPENEFATKTQEARDFAGQLNKKLYVLETGCQSRAGAGSTPWQSNGSYDEQEQADYYEIAFDNLFNKCDGMFLWHVYHNLTDPDGFPFNGKLAERVVNDYYHRMD